jgi:uncharacterized protein YggE
MTGMTDRIEVVGTGVVHVRPDVLQVQLGAEEVGADVATALESAREAAEAMVAAARSGGVADEDVRTAEMSVSSYRDRVQDPASFRAWLGLSVTLRDLVRAGDVLARIVDAGRDASRVQHASLAVSDPAGALATAREAAFADARRQADQLAALAGRQVGAVRRVTVVPGVPVPRSTFVEQAAHQSLPVEPGTSAVAASVQVRFELV